jgi:23S rRNA pseudouridine1911/1915/1917 synthase
MEIEIIFEDEDVLIINKPAGVTVNRAETTKHESTIQDWAEAHIGIKKVVEAENERKKFGDEGWDPQMDFYNRGGVVHRLDKETSGILILAKTPESFVNLQEQFRDRIVKKVYTALAHGEIAPATGEINVPVGRLPWDGKKFGIIPGGKESKTLYQVLAAYVYEKTKEKLTYVELYPQSGRTHQIRVHLKYINHPIFSDFLYAGRKTARNDRKLLPRVFLHAAKITFFHPTTKQSISFEAPLAPELVTCLSHFKKI